MDVKHTPGPWGMETVRTSCGVCHKVGPWPHEWRAGDQMSACIYDDYPSPPQGTDTMLANAKLIAAAPDMLAALEDCVDCLEYVQRNHPHITGWGVRGPRIERARAAIRKAKGE